MVSGTADPSSNVLYLMQEVMFSMYKSNKPEINLIITQCNLESHGSYYCDVFPHKSLGYLISLGHFSFIMFIHAGLPKPQWVSIITNTFFHNL